MKKLKFDKKIADTSFKDRGDVSLFLAKTGRYFGQ